MQRELAEQYAEQQQLLRAQHEAQQRALVALAARVGVGLEAPEVTVNPLRAAVAETAAPRWRRHSDDQGDVWYVAEGTGETAWEVPAGAVVVA